MKKLALDLVTTGVADFTKTCLQIYGSYVITDRAISDFRDGLKPVQRRLLYAMHKLGATNNKAPKKCARVVGETMGVYHPHGDAGIYGALVSMVSSRYPLLEGHGNFGSYLFGPAASRYTETRLSKFGEACLDDIDHTEFIKNYSSTDLEPLFLPAKVPILLVNGTSGIGVGISAGIPSHNLNEVIAACLAALHNPEISTEQLLTHIQGPDAGSGVLLTDKKDLLELYETGKGTVYFSCNYEFEDAEDHKVLILTGVCPGFSLTSFFSFCSKLVEAGLILYCSDQTSSTGLRVLVGFKDSSVMKDRVIPALTKSESYQFWVTKRTEDDVLSSETLKFYGLKDIINEFLVFRQAIEKVKLLSELAKQKQLHKKQRAIQLGNGYIEHVYAVLKSSDKDKPAMAEELLQLINMNLADNKADIEQAIIILEMPVYSLARANMASIRASLNSIEKEILRINIDLQNLKQVVERTLRSMLKFGDERKTILESHVRIAEVEETQSYVMARSAGAIFKDDSVDVKSRFFYDFITQSSDRVSLVDNKSKCVWQRYVGYFSSEETKYDLVGVISGSDSHFLVLDAQGLGGFFLNVSANGYAPLKSNANYIKAVGCRPEDRIALADEEGNGIIYSVEEFIAEGTFRRNSQGRQLDELPGKTVHMFRMRAKDILVDKTREIKKRNFQYSGSLLVIGESNYVLTSANKRLNLNKKETLKLYEDADLQNCIAI